MESARRGDLAYAETPPSTAEDAERAAFREFIDHRRRDFTGREELLNQFVDLATSDKVCMGASVTGSPGSGKSAVFSELWATLKGLDDPPLVLANAAGATPLGSQPDAMLRRFILELAEFLNVSKPIPDDAVPDEVDQIFAGLLFRASVKKRVVVLLDAVNQFGPIPRGRQLTWLKGKSWPENARIIGTSLPGESAEALDQWTGIEELEMPPLDEDNIDSIAKQVYARYHRQVNPEVVGVLKEKKLENDTLAAANPLWLTLALDQLNLLDTDDFARADREFTGSPAERLRAMVIDTAKRLPAAVADLYGRLLDYTEKAYGRSEARSFAAAVAVSRFGWRESDLLSLIPKVATVLFPDESPPCHRRPQPGGSPPWF